MNWTYSQLKTADATFNIPDLTLAANAINQQTTTSNTPIFPISVSSVHGVLMLSPTADWVRIENRSNGVLSANWLTSPTANDAPIIAAKNAVAVAGSKVETIFSDDWMNFLQDVEILNFVDDISDESQTKIQTLAIFTSSDWQPVNAGDIQTARAQ